VSTTAAPPEQGTPRTDGGLPRGLAALIGLVAVAAALGVGHLAAALVSPPSSPFLAVGDTVIRFSPQWLTEFAKTTFGTADKPVLLAGMAVVVLGIAAAGGLLSRRSALPGTAVVLVMGLIGLAVVVLSPGFSPVDLVAPLVAIAAGLAAFRLLHRWAGAAAPAAAGRAPVSRRTVLAGTSAVGVGALVAAGAGQLVAGNVGDSRAAVTARLARLRPVETAPPVPPSAAFPESIPFITPNTEFYRVDTALRIPAQSAADWTCRVHGMVDRELTLTFDDLLSRPLVERTITMTCVSNEVGGPYISTADFLGVELRDVLLEAGVRPGADQILSTSLDSWTAGTPTEVVMEPGRGALLAVGMNGEALPPEHGFPVRMLVPGLYGFLSATKWLADIELTTFAAAQGYWLQRGWGRFAPIKTQCRIDTPRGFQQVPAGPVTVSGIAWSQPTGIGRVEVRVDDGPWQDAELATEVNPSTWRMWRATVELGPGTHRVQSRATDANGVTQPEERVPPIPDGATGWPLVVFTVT
jgi:DMSO/TMAO reductase YedYZ molybdopterin-dependent catalytic subunit